MRTTIPSGAKRALAATAGSLLAVVVVGAGAVSASAAASPIRSRLSTPPASGWPWTPRTRRTSSSKVRT